MLIKRIIKVTLVVICVLFIGLQVLQLDLQAAGARALLVLLVSILYYIMVENKKLFFLLFLVTFGLGEIVNFASYFYTIADEETDYAYYIANSLYILSYIFLIIRVLRDMHLKRTLSRFWIHIAILTVLDVFCVNIVSGTTENLLSHSESWLEYIYNGVIMILLTVAMINYMSKNSQKAMNFLLGAIFIFFSEVIQYAYFYISKVMILNVMCSLFLVLAFLFFYLQSRVGMDDEFTAISRDYNS